MDSYEPAKPIEAGCRALAFSLAKNIWKTVTVIRYAGLDVPFIPGPHCVDLWEISEPMPYTSSDGITYETYWIESQLLRIDDPDEQKAIEKEKELENV